MKHIATLLICTQLLCCTTPEQDARLSAMADLAITYAERRGQLAPEDAQALRDAKVIVLPEHLPEVEVSGK